MLKAHKEQSQGFSLMEVIVSIFVLSIILLGVYSLIILSIQINAENARFIVAIEIANLKMEEIRNMAYDDIGTASGTPQRSIPDYQTVSREGTFLVHTIIVFHDDEYDGTLSSGTDLVFTDYKNVTVEVSWNGKWGAKNVTVFSKIIPNTEETPEGLGLIKIEVVDSSGAAVPSADVHIENPNFGVAVDLVANIQGKLYYPVEPDFEAWEITVTKAGYGIDRTYERNAINLNPTKPHMSVNVADSSLQNFAIDRMSVLDIHTVANSLPLNWKANADIDVYDDTGARIGIDGSDNLYIAWQKSNSTSSLIYLQKFNTGGTKQWANDKTISTTQFQSNPDIATTDSGISYIVWQDNSTFLKNNAQAPRQTRLAKSNYRLVQPKQFSNFIIPEYNFFAHSSLPVLNSRPYKIDLDNIWQFTKDSFSVPFAFAAGNITTVGVGATITTGDTGDITLPVPAGIQAGDLLLAFIHHDNYNDAPIVAPSGFGWNILDDDIHTAGSDNNHCGALFWKIVQGGDPANYTFIQSGGNEQKAGHIRAYRDVDPNDPFNSSLAISSTAYGNVLRPAPSNTVDKDGSMLVCGWGSDTPRLTNVSGGPIFPAGMLNTASDYNNEIAIASADLPVNIADSPTGSKNYDANRWVNRRSFNWSLVLQPSPSIDVTVSATGSQKSILLIPSSGQYLGGRFVLTDNTGSRNITGITIKESGSVNAQTDLANIKLFYDIDTSLPYDCEGEQYDAGFDTQFGTATNFSGPDGNASFSSAGVAISTIRTMCVYTVLDVLATTTMETGVEISISNPNTDVQVDAGTVSPNTPVEIPGSTGILKPAELDQVHYRWRDDNGDEVSADWLAAQDTPTTVTQGTTIRLRFGITNNGNIVSSSTNYHLEYGELNTDCSSIATWIALPNDNSQHWRMTDTGNFFEDDPSTNIPGLSDENLNFQTGSLKDVSNQTSGIVLADDEFTEIEYAIKATTNSNDSGYCFRLTNSGSTSGFVYSEYAEISIIGDDNIFIISYTNSGIENWTVKKVNDDMSGAHQSHPRLALTENYGSATTVVVWQDEQNGNSDIYAQAFSADGTKVWASELQITSSLNNEYSPDIIIDNSDNFIVSWTEDNGGNEDILMHKFDLTGSNVWAGAKSIVSGADNEYSPSLAIDNADNIYISWTNTAAGSKNVYLAQLDDSGNINWSTRINLESFDEDQSENILLVDSTNLYAAWTDTRDGDDDIYVQKYDLTGNAQWPEDQKINITLSTTDQAAADLIADSTHQPFCAWQDGRDGDLNIYASEFYDPGALSDVANVPLIITGTKQIGDNPVIFEYDHNFITDSNGDLNIPVEYDTPGYSLVLNSASTSLSIILRDPVQPLEIGPNQIVNWTIYVE